MKQIRIMKEICVSATGALMIMDDSYVPIHQHTRTSISSPTDSECVLLQSRHFSSSYWCENLGKLGSLPKLLAN